MEMTENLGENLKILRNLYGLTQEQMAKMISSSRSCVTNYESGNRQPDSKTLILFADFFNVSVDFLLGRSPVRTIIRNEAVLIQLCNASETTQNTKELDIGNSSAKTKCTLLEFYAYLTEKERLQKKYISRVK